MKSCVVAVCFAAFALFFAAISAYAIECTDEGINQCKNYNDANVCNELSKVCQQKITESQGQQKTLAATISYLNNRIRLTEAQIRQTEYEIAGLEREIDALKSRISGLEVSLQRLTEILITRIQDSYKHRAKMKDSMLLLLSANELNDFLTQYKLLQLSQNYTQNLIEESESQKVSYDNEKQVKEQKQAEVEALRKKLESQRVSLQDQQKQKQSLLQITQNDEKKYQSLLQQAEAQLQAFRSFVASQGGAGILSNQTKCNDWGCYYNQRDEKWGRRGIGLSGEPMSEFGCLVSSMAMVATHYGKSLDPGNIAASSSPFFGSTAFMIQGTWTANGVTTTRTRIGYSSSSVDSELEAGRPVVVGLYSSSNPSHFIVIKGKDDRGYIMHDPFMENGGDRPLTDKYSVSNIKTVDRVQVN